ncbi:tyrosinase-like protein 1 [Saccostrea cucullata]|uniref:tyrosinase-like protein 1 n=1 Tax=Saccostrea cuccullata TaxID=36930 RepID=UPI002ECFC58D
MKRKEFLFVVTCAAVFELSSALLKPIPFPVELEECYRLRSYNTTPSDSVALEIQDFCYKSYHYKMIAAGKMWSGPNITQSEINYINSLFRQIFAEAREVEKYNEKGGRHKRQAFPGRYRQEVRSPGAFRRFVECIDRLEREIDPRSGRNRYQTLSLFHTGPALASAHRGPAFGPWHRIYLLLVETACRAPIPYWDSTLDHEIDDPTDSIVWSDEYFGNGNGVVIRGPFRNMRTVLGGPIIRNYGTGQSALFTKEGLRAVLSRRRYGDITEPKVGQQRVFSLEAHHNGPHNWIGGHISGESSAAFDPVFFLHHAYVDAVWERFRDRQAANEIDPERDYPSPPYPPGHAPNDIIDFRPFIAPITNIFAMSDLVANLVRYEPFPTCSNQCNGSPHLRCQRTISGQVCVSTVRTGGRRGFGTSFRRPPPGVPEFRDSSSVGIGAGPTEESPSDSMLMARASGPIPGGNRFPESPFNDRRNTGNPIELAPEAPAIQAARMAVREVVQERKRRDVSTVSQNGTTNDVSHHQSVSSLERSFTNTFLIDGEIDLKRWVYVPVRVVHTRSLNVDGVDPTFYGDVELSKELCPTVQSGASKVFVASNGLDYFGTYKEFVIVDERQLASVTTTAVGIKNPDYGEGEVLFTAHDSCGRPCRPLCLTETKGQQKYKACSGAFKISSANPKMYKPTYRDATAGDWILHNSVDSFSLDPQTPVTFVCGNDKTWPWEF